MSPNMTGNSLNTDSATQYLVQYANHNGHVITALKTRYLFIILSNSSIHPALSSGKSYVTLPFIMAVGGLSYITL